jgi:large subunit ribosomal protein L4
MRPARLCPYPSTFLRSPLRKDILHKAVVYEANAARGTGGHTKTRGEVRGSTRKIRRQKGTGMARVGARTAGTRRGGPFPHNWARLTLCRGHYPWTTKTFICN